MKQLSAAVIRMRRVMIHVARLLIHLRVRLIHDARLLIQQQPLPGTWR